MFFSAFCLNCFSFSSSYPGFILKFVFEPKVNDYELYMLMLIKKSYYFKKISFLYGKNPV